MNSNDNKKRDNIEQEKNGSIDADEKKLIDRNELIRKIDELKTILTQNKIFFDTIIALLISIIGIVIAINANRISNELTNVTKQEALPNIDISSEYDDEGNVVKISVLNIGGPISDISVEIYPYIYYEVFKGQSKYDRILECGGCPLEIILDNENRRNKHTGLRYEKGTYRLLAPHTKTNPLYEVINTDLMNHVMIMMDSVRDSELRATWSKNTNLVINRLSLEYMLKIDYGSMIDTIRRTETFRIITGIGYGNYYTPGVSNADNIGIDSDEIINTFYNYSAMDQVAVIGDNDTVGEDTDRLLSYLAEQICLKKHTIEFE